MATRNTHTQTHSKLTLYHLHAHTHPLPLTGAQTAPLRGTVGTANDGNLIYGPMEAGFTADQIARILSSQGTCANATYGAPGGLDTMIAEEAIEFACGFNVSLLNDCGGHANPCTFVIHMHLMFLFIDAIDASCMHRPIQSRTYHGHDHVVLTTYTTYRLLIR